MNRVLIVTPGYYPAKTYGGPVVSVKNLTDTLGDEIEFYILTSNHELKQKEAIEGLPSGFIQNGKARVRYISDEQMNTGNYEKILDEVKPDCIYINAIFHRLLSPPMIKLAKKRGIRCVIAPRGGLNENALNFSKSKKLLYLQYIKSILGRNVCFQSTSDEESEAIRKHFGSRRELVELTNFPRHLDDYTEKHRVSKSKGEARIIFYSRIHPKKNLKYALQIMLQVKEKCSFDIYGPIEDKDYWLECKDLIEKMPDNVHIKYCGYLETEMIQDVLGKYDLFFFPTLSENFGHVIAEALSEKCNVLISDKTPWNDVNNYSFGKACKLGDDEGFLSYIRKIVNLSEPEIQDQRKLIPDYICAHFNYDSLVQSYKAMFGIVI